MALYFPIQYRYLFLYCSQILKVGFHETERRWRNFLRWEIVCSYFFIATFSYITFLTGFSSYIHTYIYFIGWHYFIVISFLLTHTPIMNHCVHLRSTYIVDMWDSEVYSLLINCYYNWFRHNYSWEVWCICVVRLIHTWGFMYAV